MGQKQPQGRKEGGVAGVAGKEEEFGSRVNWMGCVLGSDNTICAEGAAALLDGLSVATRLSTLVMGSEHSTSKKPLVVTKKCVINQLSLNHHHASLYCSSSSLRKLSDSSAVHINKLGGFISQAEVQLEVFFQLVLP